MAKQTINQGTAPTGAGGDTFRSGSAKLQANDDELYAQLGATAQGVLPAALPLNKGGTGATTAAAARTNLELGSAATKTAGDSAGNVLELPSAFNIGNTGSFKTAEPYPIDGGNTFEYFVAANIDGAGVVYGAGLRVSQGSSGLARKFRLIFDANGRLYTMAKTNTTNPSATPDPTGKNHWGNAFVVYSANNTTVDANGFIKKASPIIQLFADKIELNDEAQQQSIGFEKLGVGDYLIKGSSGFAQEGWYIETPKDANGNLLVAVVYEQLENGDISVKTYDYMLNNKGRIVADTETPLDIPKTRWIDLRLQELPQPEIEVTDDPEQ
ncbi:phage tail protein [Acinetobacter haemolyticus]|uniref:phage tail fiber protein n=1 Tax=Acinetobacter haemolyticus TaxID=29430 RepID=UPI001C08C454|nr:phage tail protein [Acinetobacter haemolyticus]